MTEDLRFCYIPASLELFLEVESAELPNMENQMKSGMSSQPQTKTCGNHRPTRGSRHSNEVKRKKYKMKIKPLLPAEQVFSTFFLRQILTLLTYRKRVAFIKNLVHIHRFRTCFSEATLARLLFISPRDKRITAD